MFKTRKSFLTLLTCFGLLLVFIWACKKDADVTQPDKPDETEEIIPGVTVGYGAELLDPAEYEKIPLIPEPLAPSGSGARIAKDPTPPAGYDFSSKMPPVRSQGRQGSCTSWAVAYAARTYYAVGKKGQSYFDPNGKIDESRLFSPAFVYNQKKIAADCIKGSYIFSSLDLLRSTGVCSLEDMPYREEDCETKPSAAQIQAAASGKISGWGRIRINKDAFRKFLYYDYPIIIAQLIDEHFDGLTDKDATGEYIINRYTGNRSRGAHAMVVAGYDDSRKAFKVQNSWGSNWANKGFIWVSYDVLEKVILEAYVMLTGENIGNSMPAIKTKGAELSFDKLSVNFSGSITSWGDLPVTLYGVCISTKAELPTTRYYSQDIPQVDKPPFDFVVNFRANAPKFWYRAFIETPEGIVYGDTLSVITTAEPEVGDKNVLLFDRGTIFAVDANNGASLWAFNESWGNGGGSALRHNKLHFNGNYIFKKGSDMLVLNKEGKKIWNSRPLGDLSLGGEMVASQGLVVVSGFRDEGIAAIDIASGAVKWQLKASDFTPDATAITNLSVTPSGALGITVRSRQAAAFLMPDLTNPRNLVNLGGNSDDISGGAVYFSDNFFIRNSFSLSFSAAYSVSPFKEIWKSPQWVFNGTGMHIGSERIFGIEYEKGMAAFDRSTGAVLWRYQPSTGRVENAWSASGNTVAMVISDRSARIYYLHVLDAVTGKLRFDAIRLNTAPRDDSPRPLVTGSGIFVSGDDMNMTAYDPGTGSVKWQRQFTGVNYSPFAMDAPMMISQDGKTFYTTVIGGMPPVY